MFLCLNCGTIHAADGNICDNCDFENNKEEYDELISYCQRTVHFGYDYRITFEQQVAKDGKVTHYPFLDETQNLWTFLAVGALSGIVGGIAYDIVKHLGKQILDILASKQKTEPLDNKEVELIKLINKHSEMQKFTVYIHAYLKNSSKKIVTEVEKAILHEEYVDASLTIESQTEWKNRLANQSLTEEEKFLELQKIGLTAILKERGKKPSIDKLNSKMKRLKKEIKELKKRKKKRT